MSGERADILLVEDNPYDLELALHDLGKHALTSRIEVARDGREALDSVFGTGAQERRSVKKSPKMILLDSRLPKVDGLEVLGRIKSDPRTSTIPVVMLTSSREEREYVDTHQMEGGISSYISKPVSYRQLSQVAHELGLGELLGGGLPAQVSALSGAHWVTSPVLPDPSMTTSRPMPK